jgi:DinB superfamily
MKPLIDRLERNAEVLGALFGGVGPEQAQWRPEPARWSMLEVAAHLLDEEREDFRARLRQVLEMPRETWPPIDPQGWVTARRYAERNLGETVAELLAERGRSVEWLRSLAEPDWGAAHEHPKLGTIHAGDLLVSWAAHDALHVRQLARLHYGWVRRLGKPWTPGYAGDW